MYSSVAGAESAAPASPQQATLDAARAAAAFPCEHDRAFDAFDFWVGDWDVHLADGSLAGTNRITRQQQGRVRQFFEQANQDGANWTPSFEGFYSRRVAGE